MWQPGSQLRAEEGRSKRMVGGSTEPCRDVVGSGWSVVKERVRKVKVVT